MADSQNGASGGNDKRPNTAIQLMKQMEEKVSKQK